MLAHSEMSKYIPEIPYTEWGQYIVLPPPSPQPKMTSPTVAWWEVHACYFVINCCFFVCRPQSACHVERDMGLLGDILTHDHLKMRNETLRYLAIMYVTKVDKKRKCEVQQ